MLSPITKWRVFGFSCPDFLGSQYEVFTLGSWKPSLINLRITGIGRGCSSHFLSDEQYNQRGLGIYSRLSDVSHYLSHDFDKVS